MVATYKLAGREVGSHWLAIATLGTFFVGSWAATRGPAKPKQQAPPTNANNDEEEKFIQEFIKEAEKEGNGGAKQREGGGH